MATDKDTNVPNKTSDYIFVSREEVKQELLENATIINDRRYMKTCDAMAVLDLVPPANVRPVPEWISVEERLPEDSVFVLVVNDDGQMMIARYNHGVPRWEYKYTNYDWDVWDDDLQGPITHWMPLPEPPEEGDAK